MAVRRAASSLATETLILVYRIPARYSGTIALKTSSLEGSYRIRSLVPFSSSSGFSKSERGRSALDLGTWDIMETKLV